MTKKQNSGSGLDNLIDHMLEDLMTVSPKELLSEAAADVPDNKIDVRRIFENVCRNSG